MYFDVLLVRKMSDRQTQPGIKITAFCVSRVRISNNIALFSVTVLTHIAVLFMVMILTTGQR